MTKRSYLIGLLSVQLIAGLVASSHAEMATYTNPVVAGNFPDPSLIRVGMDYWATTTSGDRKPHFPILHSTDLVNWKVTGAVFTNDLNWAGGSFWAPEISKHNDRYYVYFTARQRGGPLSVAVATAEKPEGPYTDHGPLIAQPDGSIDPVACDDEHGNRFLIWKEDGNSRNLPTILWAQRLTDDGTKLIGEAKEILRNDAPWEGGVVEGPFVLRRGEWFYLFYSGHNCCGADCHYALGVARSHSLLGPWEKNPANPILSDNAEWKCPGHGSIVSDAQGRYWLLYHAYSTHEAVSVGRQALLDEVKFDGDWPTINAGKGPSSGAPSPSAATQRNVAQEKFQNPINSRPDPWMVFHEGNYYLATTQGDAIRIWKAPTLAALKTARPTTVWKDNDPTRSTGIWAPEFHFINNRWYLYYTATSSDNNDDNHRMQVLESAGTDPLGPYTYKARLFNPTNDHYAIDGTVFNTTNGALYFVWAARPGHVLYIARMKNPYTLDGNGVYIPASGFGCEEVREGPVTLQRNGKIFLIYSACDTGKPDYKLGMLMADETADLLNPQSWKQYPRPVFERSDANGVFGPGHNGFFQSPDGTEDWIVYHAKTTSKYTYETRTTRAQKFTWNADGTPNFGVPLSLDALIDEPSNKSDRERVE